MQSYTFQTFDFSGIVDYMEKQRGDGTKEMATLKDLQKFLKEDDVTVVGVFKDDQSELYTKFTELGRFHVFKKIYLAGIMKGEFTIGKNRRNG